MLDVLTVRLISLSNSRPQYRACSQAEHKATKFMPINTTYSFPKTTVISFINSLAIPFLAAIIHK